MDAVAKLLKTAYQQYEKVLHGRWTHYLEDIMDVRGLICAQERRAQGRITPFHAPFDVSDICRFLYLERSYMGTASAGESGAGKTLSPGLFQHIARLVRGIQVEFVEELT